MNSATRTHLLVASFAVLALTAAWVGPARAAAPVLNPIANMTVGVGGCSPPSDDQAISATDPDGDAITFTSTGPSFMTLTPNTQAGNTRTGNIHVGAPPPGTFGSFPASVTATAGGESDTKTFTITIVTTDQAPALAQPSNMTVTEGTTADQTLSALDPCGAPLTFSTVTGPTFMTVTTTNGTRGNVHLAPGFTDAGTYAATVRASNGSVSNNKTFTITVTQFNRAPVLNQPANMTVEPGFTADQIITGSDADGEALTFSKVSGPTFMTVTTTNATTGNIHLATGFSEPFGTASATVSASDGLLTDSKSFTITVGQCHAAPVLAQPANMTVNEGTTADQGIVATDACGYALTFSKAAGPAFMTVTTTSPGSGTGTGNIHLAPGFADSGTYAATVSVSNGEFTTQKSFTVTVNNSTGAPVLVPIANMTVCSGTTGDQAISATDPDGDAITFTFTGPNFMILNLNPQVGNTRTGNIHIAPSVGTSGTFAASVTATANGESNTKSFTITITSSSPPPVLDQPANMIVAEGATADQPLRATSACGIPLTFSKVSGPLFMTVTTISPGPGTATGNIHLAPGFAVAGTYAATVRASDGSLANDKTFTITVNSVNRCPTSNPGGPYSGVLSAPVPFDGTQSSDPDGTSLSYVWDFDASDGITIDAVGPTPSHAFLVPGTFTVTLTVTETASPFCSHTATTTLTILSTCGATVFNGYDVIRLASGKPTWFAFVQPAGECYSNADVVLSSFVLKYAGRQIPAEVTKTAINSDKNGDGIQEIRVTFSKADLRTLFSGTGLGNGHNLVDVTIEASTVTGGTLQGTTQVDVISNSDFSAASVSPNPLNPSATLTFTTTRQGFAKIELFDIAGRLVRTILDERTLAAGTHEVKIEGRGQRGETLASGVYFIRGVSADGKFTKAIAILK